MRLPALSPSRYRRLALAALVGVPLPMVTGAAARLTGSGLGCPDWPTCASKQLVAPSQYHRMIESVNRGTAAVVFVVLLATVAGAVLRTPRRRDLVWLSSGLIAGYFGQAVLGGLMVLFKLAPPLVMAHFLLSLAILTNAVVLYDRAGQPDGPARPRVPPDVVPLSRLMLVGAGLVVFLGTVVTSSGPHGGDERAQRLPFVLSDVARVHSIAVFLFLAVTLATLLRLSRAGALGPVLRRGELLLAVIVAQGAIGYLQYFTGVPPGLVGLHIAGAAAVWAFTVRFHLGLFQRGPEGAPSAGPVPVGHEVPLLSGS